MDDDDILQAVLVTFAAIENSLETVRLLLARMLGYDGRPELGDLAEQYATAYAETAEGLGECHHPDAIEVSTLGDGPAVFICPDCGDQFE